MSISLEVLATILFGLAVLHTFSVKRFQHWACRYPEDSSTHELLQLFGEVEVVFGLWAGILIVVQIFRQGLEQTAQFVESHSFAEPAFVFVVMTVASTRPVVRFASAMVMAAARLLPLPPALAFGAAALTIGPLCGSLITEPAAMTVTAILLKEKLFDQGLGERAKYGLLATLFVNVSIGGVLTHFAAPPVLMVSPIWGWGTAFMFRHFGWKAICAVLVNVGLALLINRRELARVQPARPTPESTKRVPVWVVALHLLFLALIVVTQHHPALFAGFFLFFLGVVTITLEHQEELRLRESLLVGFFLGGLVVLGGPQRWWLEPILHRLSELPLFLSTTGLTAVLDNAALTYLGAQVPGISDAMKYALVAGAVCGGGLTVIANAPNPAGFAILNSSFGREGITPLKLLRYALLPTLIAMAAFWLLPA